MQEEIRQLWAQTRLHVWPEAYLLISFHGAAPRDLIFAGVNSAHFFAVVKERDEVSLTVSEEIWQSFSGPMSPRAVAGPYGVITFDLDLDLSVCGYFAPAALRLAEAGVCIVPQCAFLKDHILAQAEKIAPAVNALEELIASAKLGAWPNKPG
jgi:hypothetical protein